MRRKNWMIWSVVLVLVVALAMPIGNASAAKRRFVSIAAGWVTGAYFPMAGAISRIAWKHLKDDGIKVTAESSGASVANSKLIGAGDTDFAIMQNDIASSDVLAPSADIRLLLLVGDLDLAVSLLGVLDHHDRIGPRRNRGSGHDPRTLAGPDRAGRHVPGGDRLDLLQDRRRSLQVFAPTGESIHRRRIGRRHVHIRRHVRRQHPSAGLRQSNGFDRHGSGAAQDNLKGLIKGYHH